MDAAMIIKTGLAILITTLFAGGAVYYGTQPTDNTPIKTSGEIHLSPNRTNNTSSAMKPPSTVVVPKSEKLVQSPESSKQTNAANMIVMVMEQTEKIQSDELKDQAYLDVVDYAAAHTFYKVADEAMLKIKQVELRDTARSQIAISMARSGRAQEAFSVIDQVEIETLKDVMRLQVIEAMIVPQRLPLQLQ